MSDNDQSNDSTTVGAKIACVLFGVLVAAGVWYHDERVADREREKSDRERERLRNVVLAEFQSVTIPFDAAFVYQESGADAQCKTATINRVFASRLSVTEICSSVHDALLARGWKSWNGCGVSLRHREIPSNPGQLAEQMAGFSGFKGQHQDYFNLSVLAMPDGKEPIRFALGTVQGQNAVFNSQHIGSAHFSVSVTYVADRSLIDKYCPDGVLPCECRLTYATNQ